MLACRSLFIFPSVLLSVLLLSSTGCDAASRFLHGRSLGGMLGRPKGASLVPEDQLPVDKWITQPLDHFNVADQRTWQQVKVVYIRLNRMNKIVVMFFLDNVSVYIIYIILYLYKINYNRQILNTGSCWFAV